MNKEISKNSLNHEELLQNIILPGKKLLKMLVLRFMIMTVLEEGCCEGSLIV